MKYRVGALLAVVPAAVALAAPAAAGEEEFVRTMQTTYAFLTDQQLRTEGAKICGILNSGTPASEAVIMVSDDLSVSVSAAGEIVSAAVVHLNC
jgi:hypothetical protein